MVRGDAEAAGAQSGICTQKKEIPFTSPHTGGFCASKGHQPKRGGLPAGLRLLADPLPPFSYSDRRSVGPWEETDLRKGDPLRPSGGRWGSADHAGRGPGTCRASRSGRRGRRGRAACRRATRTGTPSCSTEAPAPQEGDGGGCLEGVRGKSTQISPPNKKKAPTPRGVERAGWWGGGMGGPRKSPPPEHITPSPNKSDNEDRNR